MHKGDISFMSVKQFEKFYWPTFRKLLLGLVNEGCVPWMVIDGEYDEARMEIISDLPRSSVVWNMEKTDMFKAKKILGKSVCITGNVTATQLYTYTPDEIKEYCGSLSKSAVTAGVIFFARFRPDKCNPEVFVQ
jgi:uroporphyrinogen-III decarboxylase